MQVPLLMSEDWCLSLLIQTFSAHCQKNPTRSPGYCANTVLIHSMLDIDLLTTSLYPSIDLQLVSSAVVRPSTFHHISDDAAYLHSILWATQAYMDWLRGRPQSRAAIFHEGKTISILQTRLNDREQATSDITLLVVSSLVITATIIGNHDLAATHMQGLQKMVGLRGGIKELEQDDNLVLKVCR